MVKKFELDRKSLQIGNLYYIDEKLKSKFSDSLIVWKTGPALDSFLGEKDIYLDTIYMNIHNPFVLLEIRKDDDQFSTYWYRVLTKNGKMGWFAIDDEDMMILRISFKEAQIPDE